VNPDSIDLDVKRNLITVNAERPARDGDGELIAAERPRGVFSRQLILGENLDTEHIKASYDTGVLTLQIPTSTTSNNSILPPDSHVTPKEPHPLWLASDHRPGRIRRP
jgi:HSP20 family protein